MMSYEREIHRLMIKYTLIMIAIFVIGLIIVGLIPDRVNGQDFDPCWVDNDMYRNICDQHQIDKVIDSLLERAKEWNSR